ncbi:hypothetical protein GCM10010446_17960 [Streptomyces enissocaesilis]|uniref:Uncharacterized protein n=1 Tax=Streptomyces enissocaesilis TaxID=332589 RepID=A0ABP6JKX7_9ACTN
MNAFKISGERSGRAGRRAGRGQEFAPGGGTGNSGGGPDGGPPPHEAAHHAFQHPPERAVQTDRPGVLRERPRHGGGRLVAGAARGLRAAHRPQVREERTVSGGLRPRTAARCRLLYEAAGSRAAPGGFSANVSE